MPKAKSKKVEVKFKLQPPVKVQFGGVPVTKPAWCKQYGLMKLLPRKARKGSLKATLNGVVEPYFLRITGQRTLTYKALPTEAQLRQDLLDVALYHIKEVHIVMTNIEWQQRLGRTCLALANPAVKSKYRQAFYSNADDRMKIAHGNSLAELQANLQNSL